MIPHALSIKNFLSYGPDTQIIDFKPYHLIYLSGKNGHGKSALLDAITWALWGCARKTINAVKPDQGLLRLGTTHMMVLFDFQVGDQIYRVKREFIQTASKQIAYLEFGIIDGTGAIVPLTDKTIRATQEVIERTIRLDYESFINSAFLRQGHANEFSQKSPKDRKEILSTILGLQQFDQLKRRALERAKQAHDQRHALMAVDATLTAQLHDGQDITVQMQNFNVQVKEIQAQEQLLTGQKQQYDQSYNDYMIRAKDFELTLFKQTQQEQLYKEQYEQLHKLWKNWRLVHAQQLKLPDYKELEAQKKVHVHTVQQYQQLFAQRLALHEATIKAKEELRAVEQLLQAATAQELQQKQLELERLKFAHEAMQKNYKALEELQKDLTSLHAAQQKEKEQLLTKSIDADQLEKVVAQFEKRKNIYQQWIAKANWLKTEYENIEHKKEIAHSTDPSCPLCEQNLTVARRKFLVQRFSRQERLIVHQRTRLQKIIVRLKELLVEQHHALEKGKEISKQQEVFDKELALLHQKITDNQQQLLRMRDELQVMIQKIQAQELVMKDQQVQAAVRIMQDPLYKEKGAYLAQCTAKLTAVNYDEVAHKKVQGLVDELEKKLADLRELHHQMVHQAARAEQIAQLVVTLKQHKKIKQNSSDVTQQSALLMQEKKQCELQQKQLQEQFKLLQEKKEKVREEHGRIKTRQEHIERIEKERKKNHQIVEKLNKEIEDYQIIAAAAGKDGIQALLIEEAIPEIEQEANNLLAKLTNNQAHIFIESLRDLKSGGSKETLDINISDPTGIRPYEMFSGGEAFRIDFSLRIAISKLLARRAGTSLQTLIIDEGFGSQDEEGLSLIMDALYKVQDDFEKVIVVSHLPSMRDQFPVHFVVEKGPAGSTISVVQQG